MSKLREKLAAIRGETRTYKITASPEVLDKLEQMLGDMELLGNLGHTATVSAFVDGDGAFGMKVEKESGELARSSVDVSEDTLHYDFD